MDSSEGIHSEDDLSDDLGYGQAAFATTSFDQYLAQNHKPTRTSSNIFSSILTPLTAEQYTSAIERSTGTTTLQVPWDGCSRDLLFSRFVVQLEEGFNLLLYGAGSKREVLNSFAKRVHRRRKDVIVVNAFNPHFTIKDLLASIENIPYLLDLPAQGGSGVEAQTRRVNQFYASDEHHRELYLVIHNIDAPSLRKNQAHSCLSILASNPRIHIIASVDNVAFPQLWSFTESFSRKSSSYAGSTMPSKGYAWLLHDVTTLAPYDFELIHADRSSISGASQLKSSRLQKDVPGTTTTGLLTEVAARHILVSVTQKAKKLFVLLGTKQLEAVEGEDGNTYNPQKVAFDYSMLFNLARDNFVATNDTALRALMGEFKDHGLVVAITQATGGEAVWVPLRKDALTKVVHDLQQEQD
ncbi:hypothetical protein PHLGIDRAFT_126687 [Phlebiopsis gigantea 11061_1 CR5-6]|uniref:Origin recognition complex subunit 2 n=1 Tax=Phlebiopsis gigantea (strain 11061_1 CR5-6) TaxID=745531 RepID=A0A0C3SCN5_PHLG1|nr:hypothetical protein PHLGIDRAFT_126687 [Phlebiopsis gigantea 11061_1 CR5-6]